MQVLIQDKQQHLKIYERCFAWVLLVKFAITDESGGVKTCVKDFAIWKRQFYGTAMIATITYCIADIILFRDYKYVQAVICNILCIWISDEKWINNLFICCISKPHLNVVRPNQAISSKGFVEAINRMIIRLYPACHEILNKEIVDDVKIFYNIVSRL